jgi:4-hydroxymandelate oxidase
MSHAFNLADYEGLAREQLDDNAWAYFSGGAGDEITLRDNRAAWDAVRLWPRVLRPLQGGHTRTRLLGRDVPHPLIVAPMAYQRMAHADGEIGMAAAAAAQGAGLVLSAQASTPMADVVRVMLGEVGRGPLWFQLYLLADRGRSRALIERAEAAGFEAIVLTVDAPTQGARDRERRAGFRLPDDIRAVNLDGPAAAAPARGAPGGGLCGGLADMAASWADVEWLLGATRLPVLLKGVLHPDDARQAAAMGCAGAVVSNHGGRTLDTAVSTAWALPRVADEVGPLWPLLVDGGIRRGTDVLKAMALGAHAVLVGRPLVHALAARGAQGVAHALRLLRDELEIAMAHCGCADLRHVDRTLLAQVP